MIKNPQGIGSSQRQFTRWHINNQPSISTLAWAMFKNKTAGDVRLYPVILLFSNPPTVVVTDARGSKPPEAMVGVGERWCFYNSDYL
jgi:hypothetical protein